MNDPNPPRSSVNSWLIFAGLACVVLAVIVYKPFGDIGGGKGHAAIGKKLNNLDFDALTDNSRPVTSADLAGKVVLINFWGTWCPPCRAEFPHLVAIYKKLRARDDFELLAVSCNPGAPDEVSVKELRESTESFLESRDTNMPAYADLDGSARTQLINVAAWSMAYPTTVVLDRTGAIRGMWEGYRPGTEVQIGALVEQLLAEPAAAN